MAVTSFAALGLATRNLTLNGLRETDGTPFPRDAPVVLQWTPAGAAFEVELLNLDATTRWSSGRSASNATELVLPPAATATLAAASTYFLRVRGWAKNATAPGAWSARLPLDTAPLAAQWAPAEWVGGGSQLRADFTLPTAPVWARAYATGLGAFELHCNGARVGDHLMDPGQSVYDVRTLYVGFNMTSLLRGGENHIGALLGNSKYGYLDIYANRSAAHDQSGDATRAFRLLLIARLADGSEHTLTTDSTSWRSGHGPIVYDHLWHGEVYDSRQEASPAWDAAPLSAYAAGVWAPAQPRAPKVRALAPQLIPPIRVTQRLAPVKSTSMNDTIVFDYGLNIAGFTSLTLAARDGAPNPMVGATLRVSVEHTELIGANGRPNNVFFPGMEFEHASATCSMSDWYKRTWYECANQTDAFVFTVPAANWTKRYTPTFTYHGFRFASITVAELLSGGGVRPLPTKSWPITVAAEAQRAGSDLAKLAEVRVGDGLLQSIFDATLGSHVAQLWSIPTDCPQREKRGWMGDAGVSAASLHTFYDAHAFHAHFLQLIVDAQLKGCTDQPTTTIAGPCTHPTEDPAKFFNGSVPDVTPFSTSPYGSNPGTTDWQAAFVLVARSLVLQSGALALPFAAQLWPRLDHFMEYLERLVDRPSGLLLHGARGDWVPPAGDRHVGTPSDIVAAFFHSVCVAHMAEIATRLGRAADAARYAARLRANRAAFHTHFFVGDNATAACCYSSGSQTANILALHLGAVPDAHVNATVAALVGSIRGGDGAPSPSPPPSPPPPPWGPGAHFDLGMFGMTYVFETLQAYEAEAVALEALSRTDYPSLGYMIANGGTTLWEGWAGDAHGIGTTMNGATSRNHIMFGGGVARFIAGAVGGLGIDTRPYDADGTGAAPATGWTRLLVHPSPAAVRAVRRGSAARRTPYGEARVAWVLEEETLVAEVAVPAGASASVRLPLRLGEGGGWGATVSLGGCSVDCVADDDDEPPRRRGACAGTALAAAVCRRRRDGEPIVELEVSEGEYAFGVGALYSNSLIFY